MKHALVVSLAATALLAAGPLAAQTALTTGTQIRVTAASLSLSAVIGTFISQTADSLLLRLDAGSVRAIPTAAVTGLEVRSGNRGELLGTIGALGGIALGVKIAASINERRAADNDCCLLSPCPAGNSNASCFANIAPDFASGVGRIMLGAGAGALAGYIVGGIIGSQIPTWSPAPGTALKPQFSVDRGRPTLGVSFTF